MWTLCMIDKNWYSDRMIVVLFYLQGPYFSKEEELNSTNVKLIKLLYASFQSGASYDYDSFTKNFLNKRCRGLRNKIIVIVA